MYILIHCKSFAASWLLSARVTFYQPPPLLSPLGSTTVASSLFHATSVPPRQLVLLLSFSITSHYSPQYTLPLSLSLSLPLPLSLSHTCTR